MPASRHLARASHVGVRLACTLLAAPLGAQAIAPAGAVRHARVSGDTVPRRGPLTVNAARVSGAVLGSAAGIMVAVGTGAACKPVGLEACIPVALAAGSTMVALIVSEATASAGVPRARRATIVGALVGAAVVSAMYVYEVRMPNNDMAGMGAMMISPVIPVGAIIGNLIGVQRATAR